MAIIQLKDAAKTISQAAQVAALTRTVQKLKEELLAESNSVESAWQSDTLDKETYTKELKDNIEKLSVITDALSQLGSKLQDYAQKQINTSNR